MAAWSAQGYHIQHWYELIAETQIDLYQGDGERAYRRFVAGWPALRRSLLLQMQHTRHVAVHLRGRAALAGGLAATGGERTRDSVWPGSAPTGCAAAPAGAARWRRCSTPASSGSRGARPRARPGCAGRSTRPARTGCALFKAAAQMGAGGLDGDAATAAAGEAWMRDNGAKAPLALARMLVPGARDQVNWN